MASSNGLNTSAALFRPSFDQGSSAGRRHACGDPGEASGLDTLPVSLYEDHSSPSSRQAGGSVYFEGTSRVGNQIETRRAHSFGGGSDNGFASSPLGTAPVQPAFEGQGTLDFASATQGDLASYGSDDQLVDILLPVDIISSLFDDDPVPGGSAAPSGELPGAGLRTDAFGAFGSQGFGLQGNTQQADWGHTSLMGNVRV